MLVESKHQCRNSTRYATETTYDTAGKREVLKFYLFMHGDLNIKTSINHLATSCYDETSEDGYTSSSITNVNSSCYVKRDSSKIYIYLNDGRLLSTL